MSESKTTSTTPSTPTNPRRRFSNFDEREERGESREVDEWNQHQMEAVFPHASSNNAYLLTAGYWDWSFRASPLCGKKSSSSSFSGGGGGSGSSGGAQREDIYRCPQPLHTVQHHRAETTCLSVSYATGEDAAVAVVGSRDGTVSVWSIGAGETPLTSSSSSSSSSSSDSVGKEKRKKRRLGSLQRSKR